MSIVNIKRPVMCAEMARFLDAFKSILHEAAERGDVDAIRWALKKEKVEEKGEEKEEAEDKKNEEKVEESEEEDIEGKKEENMGVGKPASRDRSLSVGLLLVNDEMILLDMDRIKIYVV